MRRLAPLLVLAVCVVAPPALAQSAETVRRCFEAPIEQAVGACRMLLPSTALSRREMAMAYLRLAVYAFDVRGDHQAALYDLGNALDQDPSFAPAYAVRGMVHQAGGDDARALADFEQALRLDPNLAPPYAGRGDIYARRGRYEQARQEYEQALRLDPNYAPAHEGLAALEGGEPGVGGAGQAREILARLDRLPPSPLVAERGREVCEIIAETSVTHQPLQIPPAGPIAVPRPSVFWSLEFVARENGSPRGRECRRAEKVYVKSDRDTGPTPEQRAAVEALTAELLRDGWEPFARGEAWYSYRFRRPAGGGTEAGAATGGAEARRQPDEQDELRRQLDEQRRQIEELLQQQQEEQEGSTARRL